MTAKDVTFKFTFPPVFGILGLIFVVAKLAAIGGVETWSWWLVLLPFYLWLVVRLAFLGVVLAIGAIVAAGAALTITVVHFAEKYQMRKRRIAREKEAMWRALNRKD